MASKMVRSESVGNPRRLGLAFEQTRPGDKILIKGVSPGGTAAECGKLAVGDVLIRVDGRAVTEMTAAQAMELILHPDTTKMSTLTKTPAKLGAPIGQVTPPPDAGGGLAGQGKPCGVGLTIMDSPPHHITSIAPHGPADRSHAVQVGDTLVAIDDELVAHLPMELLCQRVLGAAGSRVEMWLERVAPGGASRAHHARAEEISAQLDVEPPPPLPTVAPTRVPTVHSLPHSTQSLKRLLRDGVLDATAYRAGVEQSNPARAAPPDVFPAIPVVSPARADRRRRGPAPVLEPRRRRRSFGRCWGILGLRCWAGCYSVQLVRGVAYRRARRAAPRPPTPAEAASGRLR